MQLEILNAQYEPPFKKFDFGKTPLKTFKVSEVRHLRMGGEVNFIFMYNRLS